MLTNWMNYLCYLFLTLLKRHQGHFCCSFFIVAMCTIFMNTDNTTKSQKWKNRIKTKTVMFNIMIINTTLTSKHGLIVEKKILRIYWNGNVLLTWKIHHPAFVNKKSLKTHNINFGIAIKIMLGHSFSKNESVPFGP